MVRAVREKLARRIPYFDTETKVVPFRCRDCRRLRGHRDGQQLEPCRGCGGGLWIAVHHLSRYETLLIYLGRR